MGQLSRQTVLRVYGAIIISLPACKTDGDKRVCTEMGQKIQIPVPLQSHCWVRQVQPFNFNNLVWTFLFLVHMCLHLWYTSACIYITYTININLRVFAWMDRVGNVVPGLHFSMILKCFCRVCFLADVYVSCKCAQSIMESYLWIKSFCLHPLILKINNMCWCQLIMIRYVYTNANTCDKIQILSHWHGHVIK